jgi:hypothetical protein
VNHARIQYLKSTTAIIFGIEQTPPVKSQGRQEEVLMHKKGMSLLENDEGFYKNVEFFKCVFICK